MHFGLEYCINAVVASSENHSNQFPDIWLYQKLQY